MIRLVDFRSMIQDRRYDVVVLMVAAMFPIHKNFTSFVLLALFALATLFMHFSSRDRSDTIATPRKWLYFIATTGYFLLMLVSVTYSIDSGKGLDYMIANSYLLFYPLLVFFFCRPLSDRHVRLIVFAFLVSCVLLGVYLHYLFYHAGLYTDYRPTAFNDMPFRKLLEGTRFHPTYVSMWFFFGSLYIIYFLFKEHSGPAVRAVLLLVVLFFIVSTVVMSAKIALLAFPVSFAVMLYLSVRNKLIVTLACVLLVAGFVFAVFNVSFFKARFIDELNSTQLKPPVGLHTNSLNLRVGIYLCVWKVFGETWLVGTGIGDTQHDLNNCYLSYDTKAYQEFDYNTHNQYMWIAISTGVVGLALFLWMLGFHYWASIKQGNVVFAFFLVLVAVCLLGENILSRQHGVVFYSLFCSLFAMQNLQSQRVS